MDAHPDHPHRPDTPLLIDVRDRSGRRLLATTEPVDPTPTAEALSHQALAALRRSFLFAGAAPLADTLTRAFTAANHEVLAANARPRDHDRRILIGATAVAIDGSELVVALSPPGQAIVLQDGRLFAFPDLASWHPNHTPDSDPSVPLGLAESIHPTLYSTLIAPGDAILFGSTVIGRSLSVSPHLAELAANPAWLPAVVKRATTTHPACAVWLTIAPEPAPELVLPDEEEWLSPSLRRAIFIDRLRTRLIKTLEQRAPAPPTSRRATGPLGAGYVHRYRPTHTPRTPRLPIRGRAIIAFLVLFLTLGGLYAGCDERPARAVQIDALLVETDANLAAITFDQRPAAIESQLQKAESSLAAAARNGADDSALAPRRAAITAIRDRLHNVTRQTDVTRLGPLPAAVNRSSLHLLGDGDRLYQIAKAVYRVERHTLTRLLAPRQTVSGRKMGAPLIAALDGDGLMVSDSRALYRLSPGGGWQATPKRSPAPPSTAASTSSARWARS